MIPREQNEHRQLLRRVAAELRATGTDEYVHDPGARAIFDEEALAAPASLAAPPPRVTRALATFLYSHYYLGESTPVAEARRADVATAIVRREDPTFGAALRRANRGAGYADAGWRVLGFERGGAVVRKDRITLLAQATDIAGGVLPAAGAEVSLHFPNDRPYACPDYYTAIGNGGPLSHERASGVLRIYFNVCAAGAPVLLSALTGGMGLVLTRFSAKVLNHPDSFPRPDAAVAYLLRDELAVALPLLADVVRGVRAHLDARTPAFTYAFASGVGIAEQPAASEGARLSFGQHRCTLVARGLGSAFAAGAADATGRLRHILAQFAAATIDVARPYLHASSPALPLEPCAPAISPGTA